MKSRARRILCICAAWFHCCALVGASPRVAGAPSATVNELLRDFSVANVLHHIRYLSKVIGIRPAGSDNEKEAAQYIEGEFSKAGYSAVTQVFGLPGKCHSRNVIAVHPGAGGEHADDVLIIGAHYDSKAPFSPGADDNASGVGVLLELARSLRDHPLPFTVKFVAFGAEEVIDQHPDHHHYGSRYYVSVYRQTGDQAALIIGMVSIDMVGKGPYLHARSMGKGDDFLVQTVLRSARRMGLRATYKRDRGWSDHEPFELIGVPVVWVERRPSPGYHTSGDTYEGINKERLLQAGRLVLHAALTLDHSAVRGRAVRSQKWRR